jgi:hypothetical protein
VCDVRRAVDEVPLSQRALLSLGDQQALATQDEEVLSNAVDQLTHLGRYAATLWPLNLRTKLAPT